MKTEVKAIIASVVVIALCLAAVGGVTYSWFSDSDSADITVSTATVNVDLDVTSAASNAGTIGTISLSESGDPPVETIGISNLAPNDSFTVTYDIENTSSIDVVYRLYVAFVSDEMATLSDDTKNNITFNGVPMSDYVTINGNPCVVFQNWTSLATNTEVTGATFTIEANKEWSEQPAAETKLEMNIILEAYQSNYELPVENGSTTITENTTSVSGEIDITGTEDETAAVTVEFDDTAKTAAVDKTLTITATSGASTGFTINEGDSAITLDLNLDGEGVDFNEGSVTVTATVPMTSDPGDNITVVYNGTEEQPTVVSHSWTDGQLTVTFTTTHFSQFIILTSDSITVTTETAFVSALRTGMNVTLGADITRTVSLNEAESSTGTLFGDAVKITKTCNLDLAGHTLTNFDLEASGTGVTFTVKDSIGTGKMTYDANSVPETDMDDTGYLVSVWDGANAIINDGTFESNIFVCVYASMGTVTINGGTFEIIHSNINQSYDPGYNRFLLNLLDANGKNGTADIVVCGGSFINYDPTSSASENPVKNYVATGYTVTSSTDNTNTIYTVSKA